MKHTFQSIKRQIETTVHILKLCKSRCFQQNKYALKSLQYFIIFKEKIDRELADKHQKGEIQVNKTTKSYISEMTENVENTPSQPARKKRITLNVSSIAAVSIFILLYLKLLKL